VAANAYRAAVAPSQVAPGSSVTLVADSTGTVRYVVPAPDQVQIVQNQLTAAQQAQAQSQLQLQNQVSTLNTQIANLQAAHKVQIDALTQQFTQLSGSLDAVTLTLQKISPPPPPPAKS
jgi:TolA-binding protein